MPSLGQAPRGGNFAQTLAEVVVRMPTPEPRPYPFRLFM